MTFQKNNKLWMLRSKHGRDKLFATPELMWEAACEYFKWCDDNPWMKIEQARAGKPSVANKIKKGQVDDVEATKSNDLIGLPTARPYTMSGLCLYLDCSQIYFYEFKKNNSDPDFSNIITRIEHTIETQQFEGATVGAYNANIVARKLGLSEKTEISGGLNLTSEKIKQEIEKRKKALE